jgi:hypothetical protein
METTSFVLGMLSIVAVAFMAVIVWGIVKITKLLKMVKQHEDWMLNHERNIWTSINDTRQDFERRVNDMDRNAYDSMERLRRQVDDLNRLTLQESMSYTDSRIDKALGTVGTKQLIKG